MLQVQHRHQLAEVDAYAPRTTCSSEVTAIWWCAEGLRGFLRGAAATVAVDLIERLQEPFTWVVLSVFCATSPPGSNPSLTIERDERSSLTCVKEFNLDTNL